jgi:hypothetical protein
MLLLGASVVFEELAETVRFVPEPPGCPTVKASGPQLVFTLIVWFATAEMVGGFVLAVAVVKVIRFDRGLSSPAESTAVTPEV